MSLSNNMGHPSGMRVIDYFDRAASVSSGRPCMIDSDRSYSYDEVVEASHRIAQSLIADDFPAGGKVAVLSHNSALAFQCVLGALRADGVWATANHRVGVEENSFLLDLMDVDTLFVHAEVAERISTFRKECPNVRRYIVIEGDGSEGGDCLMEDWLVSKVEDNTPCRRAGAFDELAFLFNTGGTTGRPKAVMMNHRGWGALVASMNSSMPMLEPIVNLVAAPMTHAAGVLALTSLAMSGTVVIMKEFAPEPAMQVIEKHRVTYMFLPPTAIYMMTSHPEVKRYDYSSLRYLNYAGAPMSPTRLKEAIELFGPVMHGSFGQSESPMCLTAIRPDEHVDQNGDILRPGSCGRATLFSQVEIMDDEGNILPPGESGEIVARGPLVMPGYYKNDETTAEVSQFGWHHTGDIGIKDEDGWFTIVDRKKDMIISGGFNVYPAEIEREILVCDDVQDCAVVGIPDEKWGEAVHAAVELKAGRDLTAEELISILRNKLGAVKTPKSIDVLEQLPRSAVGKVLRAKVKEPFWKGVSRNI